MLKQAVVSSLFKLNRVLGRHELTTNMFKISQGSGLNIFSTFRLIR